MQLPHNQLFLAHFYIICLQMNRHMYNNLSKYLHRFLTDTTNVVGYTDLTATRARAGNTEAKMAMAPGAMLEGNIQMNSGGEQREPPVGLPEDTVSGISELIACQNDFIRYMKDILDTKSDD